MKDIEQLDAESARIEAIELDLRQLPAPEPMVRILDALDDLAAGQMLVARTPCRPQPLLDRLARLGYRCDVLVEPSGEAIVSITLDDGRASA